MQDGIKLKLVSSSWTFSFLQYSALCVCVCVCVCVFERKESGWERRLSTVHDWRLYAPKWNILSPFPVTIQLVPIGSPLLHNMLI